MKFDIKTWLIIGLAAVIVFLLLFQRSPETVEDTRKYDSLIRVAREGEAKAKELAELRKADSLETIQTKKSYDSLQKTSVAQIAYYRAHPKVIQIIREVPVIDSAFKAYDSAIVIRDDRIAQLSGELYDCQKAASIAQENFDMTMAAQKGATEEVVQENKKLKKKTFKHVLRKIRDLAIAAGIGYVAKEVVDAAR